MVLESSFASIGDIPDSAKFSAVGQTTALWRHSGA
jgi:hypothetical protein